MAIAQQYIQLLDNCLATYCQPMYQRLQPPLEKTTVLAYFEKWQIEDENLMDIFMWRNGIENDNTLPRNFSYNFTGFGVLPTLDYVDQLMKMEENHLIWKPSYFPIIVSFTGDFFLYEADKNSTEYGMLFLQCPTFGNVGDFVVSYYDSIEKMIVTINECFEAGALIYDESEMELKENVKSIFKIAKKNNPKSEYWLDS